MGHRGLSHDRAPDEPLVVGRSSVLCGWAHLTSCSRAPYSSITQSHECRVRVRSGTPICSVQFDISRSIGSDERKKNPVDDLFYVLRRQRLLPYHELIAYEVERQRSQARRKLLSSDFAPSNPAS